MNSLDFQQNYSPRNRFSLLLFWSIVTLVLSYFVLIVSILVFGLENFIHPPVDILVEYQLIITIYTIIPAFTALLFMLKFRTAHYLEPGLGLPKNYLWFLFGLIYSAMVLIPTIITSLVFTETRINFDLKPLETLNFTTNILLIDVLLYILIIPFILLFSFGGFIRIIGEEYGWRGYLLPEVIKSRNYLKLIYGLFFVGLVWTIYHIPFFTVLSPQTIDLSEMLFSLIGSFGVFFGASFAMSWAYLKTNNLWPALSLHYLWNIINPQITGNIYSNTQGLLEGTLWLNNGEGLIGGFYHFIIGLFFLYLIFKDKKSLLKQHDEYLSEIKMKYYYNNDKIHGKKSNRPKKKNSKQIQRDKYILR